MLWRDRPKSYSPCASICMASALQELGAELVASLVVQEDDVARIETLGSELAAARVELAAACAEAVAAAARTAAATSAKRGNTILTVRTGGGERSPCLSARLVSPHAVGMHACDQGHTTKY